MTHLFPFLRFHSWRMLRASPRVFVAVVAALLLACFAVGALCYEASLMATARAELKQLRAASGRPAEQTPVVIERQMPSLPWFQSTQLVEHLSRVASENKLPLDEVAYVLEEGDNSPYLRYRITLSVSANYPAIRQFANDVSTSMKHVDLDNIRCARSDIAIVEVTCELKFSAFFRKSTHG